MKALLSAIIRPLRRLKLHRKEGQTLVEYSLILAIISVVLIGVFTLLSARIQIVFSAMMLVLDTAVASH